MSKKAIGIDLGTTYTCSAVLGEDNKVQVIPNRLGDRTTPSCVVYSNGEAQVGKLALHSIDVDPRNRLYDVKRLIGRKFNDPTVQEDIRLWPFTVVPNGEGNPMLEANGTTYHPEQISAVILQHVRDTAREFLNDNSKTTMDVVITVPAYFNDGQRQATRDAGSIAGLNVLQIVNEPTAAAVAYCYRKPAENPENILVFDLGGGTFDVSILTVRQRKIRVLAVGGDAHLGGLDFDNEMVQHCIREFENKEGLQLPGALPTASEEDRNRYLTQLRRLKNECEEKKRQLASATSVQIQTDAFFQGKDLSLKFTRRTFEELNEEKFQKCVRVMDDVIRTSKLRKEDMNKILLVGGSSRIPRVQELVKIYFGRTKLNKDINEDEAVAHGAAILAAQLRDFDFEDVVPKSALPRRIDIIDVVPLPIGVEVDVDPGKRENFFEMIPKNTPVPWDSTHTFGVPHDGAYFVMVTIYQGESRHAGDNFKLGEFRVRLPPKCPQDDPVQVTITVNEEGIVHVTSTIVRDGRTEEMRIEELKGRLGQERIRQLKLI